ncbi:hypothetical protein ACFSC6_15775 [Rufibacter sediminis]|uniref:Uncharacterized protein n=1 Tax=Rufibacter sediminis TaxID=2762756 RepID=A0ABR6VWD7_9BACT|nr:hypothetical protein [Rufibacter sediminis]MBC3541495.1 hypothetical protein [Rufibacter sediminis]
MKKLAFIVAAFLVAGTSFAQTTSTSQEPKTQTTHGTTVSSTAHTELTADASGKGETVREVAKAKVEKTKEKKEKTTKSLKDEETSQREAALTRKEETKTRKAAAKSQTQEGLEAAAQKRAEQKAKARKKVTQTEAEAKVKSNANLKAARPDHDNHGETVSTVAKETEVTGQEKGQLVKQAASEKRQRAGRIETETSVTAKTRTSSARRHTKVTTGASAKGVKPVKVNAGANLKAGK